MSEITLDSRIEQEVRAAHKEIARRSAAKA